MRNASDPRPSFFPRARVYVNALLGLCAAALVLLPVFAIGAEAPADARAQRAQERVERFAANKARREAARRARSTVELEAALEDEHALVRGEAAKGLGKRGGRRAKDLLASEDEQTRRGAVRGLAEAGEGAAELIGLLGHADKRTRWDAAKALGRLGAAAAAEPLKNTAQNDSETMVRAAAVEALAGLGAAGRAALIDLSKAGDRQTRRWAENVLKTLDDATER